MPVTAPQLLKAIQKKDKKAQLFESVDPMSHRISGIVVTTFNQDQPDIVRAQRLGQFLRDEFQAEATTIGPFKVLSPAEWQRRLDG